MSIPISKWFLFQMIFGTKVQTKNVKHHTQTRTAFAFIVKRKGIYGSQKISLKEGEPLIYGDT